MIFDAVVVPVSVSSVYHVLKGAGLLGRCRVSLQGRFAGPYRGKIKRAGFSRREAGELR